MLNYLHFNVADDVNLTYSIYYATFKKKEDSFVRKSVAS